MATCSLSTTRARRHRQSGRVIAFGVLGATTKESHKHNGRVHRLPEQDQKTATKNQRLSISAILYGYARARETIW